MLIILQISDKKETSEEMTNLIRNYIDRTPVFGNDAKICDLSEWLQSWYTLKKDFHVNVDEVDGKTSRVKRRIGDEDTLYQAMGNNKDKKVEDFEEEFQTTPERYIPKWDISVAQLQSYYDVARLARDFKWTYTTFKGCGIPLKKITYMRRLPWLYPNDGISCCPLKAHVKS